MTETETPDAAAAGSGELLDAWSCFRDPELEGAFLESRVAEDRRLLERIAWASLLPQGLGVVVDSGSWGALSASQLAMLYGARAVMAAVSVGCALRARAAEGAREVERLSSSFLVGFAAVYSLVALFYGLVIQRTEQAAVFGIGLVGVMLLGPSCVRRAVANGVAVMAIGVAVQLLAAPEQALNRSVLYLIALLIGGSAHAYLARSRRLAWHSQRQLVALNEELVAEVRSREEAESQLVALRRSELAAWRSLVKNLPDLLAIIEDTGRIVYLNHSLFGDTTGGMMATLSADERHRLELAIDGVFTTGEPARLTLPTLSGQSCMVRLGPILKEQEVERVMLIASDVTENERLHRSVMQTQKLQVVGALAGGIAHDFNNVLGAILTAGELGRMLADPSSEEHEIFGEICEACEHGAGLVRQLPIFYRDRAPHPEPVELGGLVGQLQRVLSRLVGGNITLSLQTPPAPLWACLDASQLEQILLNLAVNARDAMPDGGALRIALSPAGERVVIEVEDDGIGMPEEVRRHIFEPFFTTKDSQRGTGLGLSTVRRLVDELEGTIEVRSAPGEGTCFRIALPAVPPPAERSGAAPAADGAAVLLVEDMAATRSMVTRILVEADYQVESCADVAGALEVLDGERAFSLLLTDLRLPDGDGLGVADAFRRRHPAGQVLFMSGQIVRSERLQAGVADGSLSLLSKPFSRQALLEKVHEALSGG